ncbi:hypothetical protein V6N11_077700 [Hibiscus sabdariffa]|uniref:BHLH domain-containing protein n=1 Tax=Hibiscus sabdariffa TaxID=183260 RepID=A0ABR2TDU2_9ROSI
MQMLPGSRPPSMAEKQKLEPVPPMMTRQLHILPSMCDPDAAELVCPVWEENGGVSIRGLSSRKPRKNSSAYFSPASNDARIHREGGADSTKMDRHRKNKITCLQTGYQELRLPELYEDEADRTCYDKQLVDLNIAAADKFNVPQLEEEIVPQQTMNNDRQVPQSCYRQSREKINPRIDEKTERVNFPLFLRSPDLHDSQGEPRSGIPTRSNPFEKQGKFMEPQKKLVPDEQSKAVGFNDSTWNMRLPCSSSRVHGPSSSSVCSRGASNSPTYTLKTRYEDTDLSDNNATEEAEETTKAAPSKGSKRKRKPEAHSLSERRRRDKINKKMRALQELIPNCNKVDKVSVLDEAIEYLKTLQLQVQMMSMGNSGVYMPPVMLPASSMQHMNAPPLGGYSPMAVAMQMARFPSISSLIPAINQARLNMLGLPGQVLLPSQSPFMSLAAARFPRLPVQIPVVSRANTATAAVVTLSTPMDLNRTHKLEKYVPKRLN